MKILEMNDNRVREMFKEMTAGILLSKEVKSDVAVQKEELIRHRKVELGDNNVHQWLKRMH